MNTIVQVKTANAKHSLLNNVKNRKPDLKFLAFQQTSPMIYAFFDFHSLPLADFRIFVLRNSLVVIRPTFSGVCLDVWCITLVFRNTEKQEVENFSFERLAHGKS